VARAIHARNRCVCFGHIENVGKQALEQSGKYPVNEIDEEIFRRALSFSTRRYGSIVMAGLVPAIHVFSPRTHQDVDARDKPGHDAVFGDQR
jgi:hypothetical protein